MGELFHGQYIHESSDDDSFDVGGTLQGLHYEIVGDGIPQKLKDMIDAITGPDHFLDLNRYGNIDDVLLSEIFDYIIVANKASLITGITLRNTNVSQIPKTISEFTNLSELRLGHNKIKHLPVEVSTLKKLKLLFLSWNSLESLPTGFGDLALEELYLSDNKFDHFPAELYALPEITILDIAHNHITDIGDFSTGTGLGKLQHLFINDNQITSLPESLGLLTSLVSIRARSNNIKTIPDSIDNLTKLKKLLLSHNHIKRLPQEVFSLPSLENFDIGYNPITSVTVDDAILSTSPITFLTISSPLDPRPFLQLQTLKQLRYHINPFFTMPDFTTYKNDERISLMTEEYGGIISKRPDVVREEHYNNFAQYDPENFIFLLEDSREKYDDDDNTVPIWGDIPHRSTIVQQLTPDSLLSLLSKGRNGFLNGFETTFAHVFNAYLKKDPDQSHLSSLPAEQQWAVLSTVAQMLPRYLNLDKMVQKQSIKRFFQIFDVTDISSDNGGYNLSTVIDYLLPIILVYKTDKNAKKIIFPFLQCFCSEVCKDYTGNPKPVPSAPVESETDKPWFRRLWDKIFPRKKDEKDTLVLSNPVYERYTLTAMVVYLLASIDTQGKLLGENKDDLNDNDEKMYAMDMGSLDHLDFYRTKEIPGITHMYFDNDEDGLGSLQNFLGMAGFSLNTLKQRLPTSIGRNGLYVTMDEDGSGCYRLDISDDADKNTVLHKVYFNKLEDGQNQTPLLGSPDIIVDRGHAGTSGLALGNIKLNTKLIVFGSCGGHGNISEALESNSRLQVIGTTATGSMMVNDPLFWSIIHDGIKKKRIDRVEREPSETFINMLDETGKKSYDYNRERYILPHENLQQLFAEKYKSLIDPASSGNMPEGEG